MKKIAIFPVLVIALAISVTAKAETIQQAEQHFEKANELLKRMDYECAIAEYSKVINLSSGSKAAQDAQYWIGQSHFRAGRLDDAISAFQKLLVEYPASTIIPTTKLMIEQVEQAKKNKPLFAAVRDGDIEQVKKLISQGADINAKDERGLAPLWIAAKAHNMELLEMLIAKGADVNTEDENGHTVVDHCILEDWAPRKYVVELLVSKGARSSSITSFLASHGLTA